MAWQEHLDVSFQLFLFPSIHPITVEMKGLSIREIGQAMFGLGASSHMYDSQSKPPLINQMLFL